MINAYRFLNVALGAIVLVPFSGCSAVEQVDGTTITYTNTWTSVLLLSVFSFTLIGIGAAWVASNYQVVRPPLGGGLGASTVKSKRKYVGGGKDWGVLIAGIGCLVLGVPGLATSHVTITPEQVEISDSWFWLASNQATIRLADIQSIETETEERMTRRGRRTDEYVVFRLTGGTRERVKSGVLVRAALPKIMAAAEGQSMRDPLSVLELAQAPHGSSPPDDLNLTQQFTGFDARPKSVPPASTSENSASSIPAPPVQPPVVSWQPKFSVGQRLEAQRGFDWVSVEVVSVGENRLYTVREADKSTPHEFPLPEAFLRLPEGQPTPSGTNPFKPKPSSSAGAALAVGTSLPAGTKLEAEWAGSWLPVTVLSPEPDGKVRIHWEGYSDDFDEALPRQRLRLPQ